MLSNFLIGLWVIASGEIFFAPYDPARVSAALAEQRNERPAPIGEQRTLARRGGVEQLATKTRSGRPAKAAEAYIRLVAEVVEKEPQELGYHFTVWSIDRLRLHLVKETGIELSEARFRALLKARGYRIVVRNTIWGICRTKMPRPRPMNCWTS